MAATGRRSVVKSTTYKFFIPDITLRVVEDILPETWKFTNKCVLDIAFLAAALGPLACLAAALGPLACLAAALGPLACLAPALGPLAWLI